MRATTFLLPLFAAILLSGCNPQERVWWSPDGTRAAVIVNQQLLLTDADGKVLEKLPEEPLVQAATWTPDQSALFVNRVRAVQNWSDTKAQLPATEAQRIEELATAMPDLIRTAIAIGKDADSIHQLLGRVLPGSPELIHNAFLLAERESTQPVNEALTKAPTVIASLQKRKPEEKRFAFYELISIRLKDNSALGTQRVLLTSVHQLGAPKVSPRFPVMVYPKRIGQGDIVSLVLRSLDGTSERVITTDALPTFDWTPNGNSIACMVSLVGNDGLVSQVQRIDLLDETGQWFPEDSSFPSQDLAAAVVPFKPRLDVLPNGTVLFASQPAQLPLSDPNPQQPPNLYLVSMKGGEIRPVPVPEGGLPTNLGFFSVSPDGQSVAVVESDTDAVAVVDVYSGRLTLISEPHPNWKCRTLPSWRTSNALTYASLDPASGKVRWMEWDRDGVTREISADWPAENTENWLEYKESETKEQN